MTQRFLLSLVVGSIAALFAATPAVAQDLGIKGGGNFSRFVIDPEDSGVELKRLTGPTGGVFLVGGRGPVAIHIEALYSVRGSKATVDGVDEQLEITYLDVPLLLRFNGAPSGNNVLFAVIGPTLGFRLDVKDPRDPDADLTDDIEDREVGLTFGLGVQSNHVLVEGRYTYGLTNIVKDAEMGSTKLRTFSVTVGFVF